MTDLLKLSDPVSNFWKCPKKVFFNDLLAFLTTFFDMFSLIRSIKTFFKSPGCWHECRPIWAIFCIYIFFFILLYKKKGGFGGPNKISSRVSGIFWHILTIKITDFLKLELFLRPSLKTRKHDGSAHTFGCSQRFLEVPQEGGLTN